MESYEPDFRRARPSPLRRLLFRAPVLLYRGPIADLMASRGVLQLMTRGRKTGVPRTGLVSFMAVEQRYVIFSGWGVTSNWYRNLRADPEVTIAVGRRRTRARAELIADPARRQELMRQMRKTSARRGPPPAIRPLLKILHIIDYDGELDQALQAGPALPVVEITPHT